MGLDLYVLATLQKKLEVWFRTISDSAMIYITGDVGSGLYPVAHRVIPLATRNASILSPISCGLDGDYPIWAD